MALTEIAGAAGGLAGATPYGAAIGAAAGVLNTALADKPTNVGGSGTYQAGPFTVGNKQVGGHGNSAGATTATASQTPAGADGAGAGVTPPQNWQWYLGIIGIVLAAAALFFTMHGHHDRRERH